MLLVAGLPFVGGCEKQEQVSVYTVAKPPAAVKPAIARAPAGRIETDAPTAGEPGRILGAIVPHGEKTWYFKLMGPAEGVEEQIAPFLGFIRSLRFEEDVPRWTLPEGWTERPGNQFRFATIVLEGGAGPLELTVSPLPTGEEDLQSQLLANVNRWRGQMQVAPLEPAQLDKAVMKLDVEDLAVWLVNIQGRLPAGGAGNAAPPRTPVDAAPQKETSGPRELPALPFAFALPEGWKRKPAGPMRVAEFEVRDGERKVTVSASTAGGDLLANVNRWRGQIGLDPVNEEALRSSVRKIAVGRVEGEYVELVGPKTSKPAETILGVIVPLGSKQWFFKLQGDAGLAKSEQSRFEAFVKSIQFRDAAGGTDGQ